MLLPVLEGVILNEVPVHTVVFRFTTKGLGWMNTVNVNGVPANPPEQAPKEGVTT